MANRPLRIDWPRIKEVYTEDFYVIALMSKRASSCILSLMHLLEYQAAFRVEGYDFEDWDELQHVLSEADREIGAAMPLTEIIEYIDDIEGLLRALQYTANCCDDNTDITDGDFDTEGVFDGVGDVPQDIIDAGYASDSSDWAGFDDYKCMISYLIVDDLEAKLRKFAPYVDSAGIIVGGIATIASIITTIFTGGLTAIALGIIASTGITALLYQLITDGSVLNGFADDVAENREELACSVYSADGAADAHSKMDDKIDELFDVATATILKLMNLGPTIKTLYGGRYDQQNVAQKLDDLGYETSGYDCSCLGPPEPQDGCLTGLLRNCGFEDGVLSPWYITAGVVVVNSVQVHDGIYSIDGDAADNWASFRQDFIATDDASEITIDWWHFHSSRGWIYVNDVLKHSWDHTDPLTVWRDKTQSKITPISSGDEIGIEFGFIRKWGGVDSVNVTLTLT